MERYGIGVTLQATRFHGSEARSVEHQFGLALVEQR